VKLLLKKITLIFVMTAMAQSAGAQYKKSGNILLKDSLDNAFDLSNFIIDVRGFLPVPFMITEPALGGIGGGLALVFIKKHDVVKDSAFSNVDARRIPPDITGIGGMYTANNTWGLIAFRSAAWIKARSKYRVLGGYADVNLDFYRENSEGDEEKYAFNLRTFPAYGTLLKNFGNSAWSAGLSYLFLRTEVKVQSDELPSFVTDEERSSDVSMPGVVVEVDTRDNIFTPDKGVRVHTSLGWSDGAVGSDHDYLKLMAFAHSYFPISDNLISGWRLQLVNVFNDPPFYLVPFIELRGVPTARYQGDISSVAEGELRWDFVSRWSLMLFGGAGKAFDEWNEFDDSDWVGAGGTGFRYLIARKFKLRMGVDVARGPEQWAYYVVMGSAWLK
jgi:hypothetical protein